MQAMLVLQLLQVCLILGQYTVIPKQFQRVQEKKSHGQNLFILIYV